MSFFLELKNRLIFILLSIFLTTLVTTIYKEFLIYSITLPLIKSQKDINNIYFIYTNLTDIFDAYLKMLIVAAFRSHIISSSYQIFNFLTPALYRVEQRILKKILITNIFSIVVPHLFLCHLIIPLTVVFFEKLRYSLKKYGLIFYFENKINEYMIFYIQLYFITYILFLIIFIFTYYLSYKSNKKIFIKNSRKPTYVICYLVSAFLTPPDLICQMLVFISITIIFEIIVLMFMFYDSLARKPIKTYQNTRCKQ